MAEETPQSDDADSFDIDPLTLEDAAELKASLVLVASLLKPIAPGANIGVAATLVLAGEVSRLRHALERGLRFLEDGEKS